MIKLDKNSLKKIYYRLEIMVVVVVRKENISKGKNIPFNEMNCILCRMDYHQ